MRQQSIPPSITVTIGNDTREYVVFVTTAPAQLDMPGTVTLETAPFASIVAYAADPFTHDEIRGRAPARLVLVDVSEGKEQRARYLGHQHVFLPADPWFVGLDALQSWLWLRLQSPSGNEVAA